MLLFLIKLNIFTLPVSVIHLANFGVWGFFSCLSQLSIDKVKARHCCFERSGPRGSFLAEIRIRCSIFPSNAKKDSQLDPFQVVLGKSSRFPLQFELLLLHYWSFQLSNMLWYSLKLTLATAPG